MDTAQALPPLTVQAIEAWLMTQNPKDSAGICCYPKQCLVSRYMLAHGVSEPCVDLRETGFVYYGAWMDSRMVMELSPEIFTLARRFAALHSSAVRGRPTVAEALLMLRGGETREDA